MLTGGVASAEVATVATDAGDIKELADAVPQVPKIEAPINNSIKPHYHFIAKSFKND